MLKILLSIILLLTTPIYAADIEKVQFESMQSFASALAAKNDMAGLEKFLTEAPKQLAGLKSISDIDKAIFLSRIEEALSKARRLRIQQKPPQEVKKIKEIEQIAQPQNNPERPKVEESVGRSRRLFEEQQRAQEESKAHAGGQQKPKNVPQQPEAKITEEEFQLAMRSIQPFTTHGMLIFLDDFETFEENRSFISGAIVTPYFFAAVAQKAGPILVSTSLVRNLITFPNQGRKKFSTAFARADALLAAIKKIPEGNLTEHQKTIIISDLNKNIESYDTVGIAHPGFQESLQAMLAAIDDKTWLIKIVNEHLLLLIPRTYIQKIVTKYKNFYKNTNKNFSELEYCLGLKVDHMKEIESISDYVNSKFVEFKGPHVSYLIPFLDSIFITRNEYFKAFSGIIKSILSPHVFIPTWAFYLDGHGQYKESIAGITLSEFKLLLAFLENKLKTKLLVYSSCYAAGYNARQIYEEYKNTIPTHSFAIITQAAGDALVRSTMPEIKMRDLKPDDIDFAHKKLKIHNEPDFFGFMTKLSSSDVINFRNLLSPIFRLPVTRAPGNVPQIKLPGIPWFSILDIDQNIVSVGATLAMTRDPNNPLNIRTFFKRTAEPTAILFYSDIIPFELIIPTEKMPIIISMVQDPKRLLIKKITTSDMALESFFEAIYPQPDFTGDILFIIGELNLGSKKFKNVVIENQIGSFRTHYFTDDKDIEFEYSKSKWPQEQPFNYSNKYQAMIREIEQPTGQKRINVEQMELIRKAQERKIREIEQKKAEEKRRKEMEKAAGKTSRCSRNKKIINVTC